MCTDVFLTPLKPPTKASISLEAIQSSLYYLHVSSEEDELVKRSIDEERRSQDLPPSESHVARKPLPPTPHANYPAYERPAPPPKSYPSYQPGIGGNLDASQGERYSARGSHLRLSSELRARDPNVVARMGRSKSFRQGSPSGQSDREVPKPNVGSFVAQPTRPQERVRSPDSQVGNGDMGFFNGAAEHVSSSDAGGETLLRLNAREPTITLIRRDPVSGGQWNVGLISQLESSIRGGPPHPMMVELNTPGYCRFSHSFEMPDVETTFTSADSIMGALAERDRSSLDGLESSPVPQSFTRTIDFREHDMGHRRSRFHYRTQSSTSLSASPSPTRPPRLVYSFTSPWKGLCTFNRGIDARSLKCHHTLPSAVDTDHDNSAEVAELRFNLPRSTLASASIDMEKAGTLPISELVGPRSGKEALRRSIQQFKNLRLEKLPKDDEKFGYVEERATQSPDAKYSELDSDRISLKLGREKAGGGYRGTSAKLGKLIISDEGLKMCDLVVAACMGVWWQHYEAKL